MKLYEVEQAAVRLLASREHSRGELRRKLASRCGDDRLLEQALNNLTEQGLQSDGRFAEQYVLSRKRKGFGPARNIVAFTGGDLTCRPEFYAQCATLIKDQTRLWTLIETNGYGLPPRALDLLQTHGVDAFWLDIKAWDDDTHRWLTGCTNKQILKLPAEILQRGFVLEVLSLYIPEVVGSNQLEKIARHLASVDARVPFTILAFFPEHRMTGHRSPTTAEMIAAYERVKTAGLQKVRLGNIGVFAKSEADYQLLTRHVAPEDR